MDEKMGPASEINRVRIAWAHANLENRPDCAEYDNMISGVAYSYEDATLSMKRITGHEIVDD